MRKRLHIQLFALSLIILSTNAFAARIISTASGEWDGVIGSGSSLGAWNLARNPQSGDTVVIAAGHTITLTQQDFTFDYLRIEVFGTLAFADAELYLTNPTSSVYIDGTGQLVGQSGTNKIEIGSLPIDWPGTPSPITGPTEIVEGSILPLKLLYFKALNVEGKVELRWESVVESDLLAYEVERSVDAKNYKKVSGEIQRKGSGTSAVYTLIDNSPLSGVSYYRLKAINRDNSVEVFNAVALFLGADEQQLSIFPNPLRSGKLFINSSIDKVCTVKIFDAYGKAVLSREIKAGFNELDIYEKLSGGVYLIQIFDGVNRRTSKLMVQ